MRVSGLKTNSPAARGCQPAGSVSSDEKNSNKMSETIIVIDLETTGLYPGRGDMIIEIAALPVRDEEIKTDEAFVKFVNPEKSIPPDITKINHITDEMVINAETIETVLPDFLKYIQNYPLAAHNASFDTGFLRYFIDKLGFKRMENRIIDTLELSKELFMNEKHHNLDAVLKRLGIHYDKETRHRSLTDTSLTALALVKMRKMLKHRSGN